MGRLPEELNHDVEALEGVVDEDVLLADGGEAVAAMVADALREPRLERAELQVRAVGGYELRQLVQPEHTIDHDRVLRFGVQVANDEAPELLGHERFDLDAHDRSQPALA